MKRSVEEGEKEKNIKGEKRRKRIREVARKKNWCFWEGILTEE